MKRLIGCVVALVCVFAWMLPARAEAATPSTNSALERVGACIAGGGEGDLQLLIDTSGSLAQTDPTDARVAAAKYLMGQLSTFVSTNNARIDVAIAGFAAQFEQQMNWTQLTSGSLPGIDAKLDTFSHQNSGQDTDYWNALTGARKSLEAQGATSGAHCPMVVLITDGEYSIQPRDTLSAAQVKQQGDPKPYAPNQKLNTVAQANAAVADGIKDLCRPTGLADQLRSDNITTVAIGLSSFQKPDFSLLQGISTGTTGTPCGSLTKPAPGAFFKADNIDDLFFAFDQFAAPGEAPIAQTAGVCTKTACPQGAHTFVVDSSIGRVHALADSTVSGAQVQLRAPSGKVLDLQMGSSAQHGTLASANITWRWVSPRTISVDLQPTNNAQWTGQWALTFIAQTSGSRGRACICSVISCPCGPTRRV
ncbi:vWA domain-containing protein [Rudaeicoccus suwonensis]|uniref:von Willebrand factor type A domain-containing protein n=1 Tax=Rudaeicoccus suwonensis TaxID=657409 RepID=A0A561E0U7_9MICO|nr:vWA domain-containing protein [Rudaeicoccus suwonensis]TWE09223.1 von Willebrand factor type A domain-containing protein [Rudaeicoccus suwonensis]